MENYVWLFPIIFIFHDMEEIIGFGLWLKRNKKLLEKKYPFMIKTYKDFSTEGFALAVFEELLLCIIVSACALLINLPAILYVWLGALIACTLHFIIHIGQSLITKKYIPALITSIICLPISIIIIYKCFVSLPINKGYDIFFIILGVILVAINLKLAQKMIGWFTRKTGIESII